MKFRVIEGGKASETGPVTSQTGIRAEAERRIRATGYEQYRVRSLATGRPIPSSIRYLKMQIEFVADKLEQLNPIPHDFTDDKYWPATAAPRVFSDAQRSL
ncbi:hypothetical protein [Sinorhizobium alkalisoli]|uniref:Uncharacterized protein n=1 Tax=Sinorhizobium alkalisoli TaxID=1752398 RepID=A0A1E3VCQ6_9HYPH|nr:hypothetical protein [Sinorhizobium alkalisoli]MCA1493797.1 hypothetical protein [Ensifer sp. NBAIM29]MCG5479651.1 hypothetical protein [Sinorhizobium alkalisoli]ODR91237.1 hypothetical protein A8M32_10530 [Sinorhizobium alkalisoli]QFI66694.1 hypothetical protein EKH55_1820 [Sinorhizobium alkalisoli]